MSEKTYPFLWGRKITRSGVLDPFLWTTEMLGFIKFYQVRARTYPKTLLVMLRK